MRQQTKILIILYCITILCAHTFFPYLWESSFYHLNALSFVFLTRIVWFRLEGSWRLVALVMHVTALNNLADELFFNPVEIDYNEYFTLLVSIAIVYKHRDKWRK